MATISSGTERVRTLYSVMAGVPTPAVHLDFWRQEVGGRNVNRPSDLQLLAGSTQPECGALACGIGFACAYPPFMAKGLSWYHYQLAGSGGCPQFLDKNGKRFTNFEAASKFFFLSGKETFAMFAYSVSADSAVFADRDVNVFDSPLSDKQHLLMRIRNYLYQKGLLTGARYNELRAMERADSFDLSY